MSISNSVLTLPSYISVSAGSTSISNASLGYVSGLTSSAQTQLTNNANAIITASANISTLTTNTTNISYSSAGSGSTFITNGNTVVNALTVSNKMYAFVSQNLSGSSTITFPLREYYNCGTANSTQTLPTVSSTNDGSYTTFFKTSLTNTITLSSGSSNMFAYGSTTATSSLSITGTTTFIKLYTNGTNWYEISCGVPTNVISYNRISGSTSFTGGLNLAGDITTSSGNFINSIGYYFGSVGARQGSSGGTVGNMINFWWTGSALQSWVDITNIGNFTISDYRVKENINYNVGSVLTRICSIPMIEYTIKDISIFIPNGIILVVLLIHFKKHLQNIQILCLVKKMQFKKTGISNHKVSLQSWFIF
jgi:hypothetical protein